MNNQMKYLERFGRVPSTGASVLWSGDVQTSQYVDMFTHPEPLLTPTCRGFLWRFI